MPTLLAFVCAKDPLSEGLIQNTETLGPVLKLLQDGSYRHVYLLTPKGLEANAAQTLTEIEKHFPQTSAYVKELPLVEIKNFSQGVSALSEVLSASIAHANTMGGEGRVVLYPHSATPEMRAALVILENEITERGEILEAVNTGPKAIFQEWKPNYTHSIAEPKSVFIDDLLEEIGLIGEHPLIQKAVQTATALAEHDTPILIQGETGTGKDVFAKLIHRLSPRHIKPLMIVNCATLPEALAESILFGHTKGAFTGATQNHKGKFEKADGGTLFLDELGELSPNNQSKLLRVIEDGIVEALGSNTTRKINVRLITATNRNLAERVEQGLFREDLYYRLRIGEIWLPPLRERSSDVPKIALHYLSRINPNLKEPKQLTQASLEMLRKQAWPGNVRDLRNAIERAAMLSTEKLLSPSELQALSLLSEQTDASIPKLEEGFSLEHYLGTLREKIIHRALEQSGGNQSKAARLLGITPQAVHKYLKNKNEISPTRN